MQQQQDLDTHFEQTELEPMSAEQDLLDWLMRESDGESTNPSVPMEASG